MPSHPANVPKNRNIEPSQATDSKGSAKTEKRTITRFLKRYGIRAGEWRIGLKADDELAMRPGKELTERIRAALLGFSRGYMSELAIKQVGKTKAGAPILVPVTPAILSATVFENGVKDFALSLKREPTDQEKDALRARLRGPKIRAAVEYLEKEEGFCTAITPARKGNGDIQTLIKERFTFEEARAQKLITPIAELSQTQRQKLAGRSFIYVHTRPRPATMAALTRRTLDDLSQADGGTNGNKPEPVPDQPERYLLKFGRAHGVTEPNLASWLVKVPALKADYEQFARIEQLKAENRDAVNEHLAKLAPVIATYHETGKLPELTPEAVQSALPGLLVPEATPAAPAAPAPPQMPLPDFAPSLIEKPVSSVFPPNAQHPNPPGEPRHVHPTPNTSAAVNPNGNGARKPDTPIVTTPPVAATAADTYLVLTAMRPWAPGADDDAAAQMLQKCRAHKPNATAVQVAEAVKLKGPPAQGKGSPVGHLLASVPKLFAGEAGKLAEGAAGVPMPISTTEDNRRRAMAADLEARRKWR